MKLAVRPSKCPGLALSDGGLLPGLLDMPSELVTVSFRGARVQVLASRTSGDAFAGPPITITDPLHLELTRGSGKGLDRRQPVKVRAVIEARVDPVLAVRRASRWAAYAARVAVTAQARLTERALLEAQFLGVWLIAADAQGTLNVVTVGEPGPVVGAARGLLHRELDELAFAALLQTEDGRPETAKSSATT